MNGTITQNGGPYPLGSNTVTFNMRPIDSSTKVVSAPAVIIDAPTGQVQYQWQPQDVGNPGDYVCWWTVNFAGGPADSPEFAYAILPHGPIGMLGLPAQVRRLIADGQPSSGEPPFQMTRLESLSDQIPFTSSPTQVLFHVRFTQTPTQNYVAAWVIPGSLVCYVDFNAVPVTPTSDADFNGQFSVPSAPQTDLKVSYGWQYHTDQALDAYLDQARAWLQFTDLEQVPDALTPALTHHAASLAMSAMAARCNQPNVSSGSARADLSDIATRYSAEAAVLEMKARAYWEDYELPPSKFRPVGFTVTIPTRPYQPMR
jgi:hypothetical protein